MNIKIHCGAEEIGGNCIELQSGESRILLDYGSPLPKIDPVSQKVIRVDPKKAVLNIDGLYTDCAHPIDGLIISHTHADHYGMLFDKPINPKLPVYMSEIMEEIIRITGKMTLGHRDLNAGIKHFKKGIPFRVGKDFKLTPYLMDHSAAESFAFLIEAEGKKVIYTGDYREHGHKKGAFAQFVNTNMGDIDVLITEGTMAGAESETGKTEKDVMFEISDLIKPDTGTVYVMGSGQNVDLLSSSGGIADKTGRYLLVDAYVALILERLKALASKNGPPLKIPGLEKEYFKVVDNYTLNSVQKWAGQYSDTIQKIKQKIVSWDWVTANLNRLIIPVRTYSQTWVDKYIKNFDNALFIFSMWDGYQEGIEFHKTIEYFEQRGLKANQIHVSGHAYFSTIRKLINNKNPKHIIPIHTEHPEIFQREFGSRVHVMKNGESWTIPSKSKDTAASPLAS